MKQGLIKRLNRANCLGIVIDVQHFFLQSLKAGERTRIEAGTQQLVTLFNYLKIPVLVTLERPLEMKGPVPENIMSATSSQWTMEKDFFDLTAEVDIKNKLPSLGKQQVIIAGCETDVCVLQSCLGLLEMGFEVFVVEDLLFSSAENFVTSAIERMRENGAVILSFKTLFHELLQAVRGSDFREKLTAEYGPLPDLLSDL